MTVPGFDTRLDAFQEWQASVAQAGAGRGRDLNDSLGNLPVFAEGAQGVVDVLNRRSEALKSLVANTGRTFADITSNETALRTLIQRNTDVFDELGGQRVALAQSIKIFPTFLAQSKATLARLRTFSVNTNPLGTGSCTLALGTGLTTRVSDPDGIAGIQLWVRKPGAATYKRLSHDFTNNGGTWNDFINAKDDGVTTAGTLSYYALATDTKGAKTKSKTRSIKIVRCDTEAQIAASTGRR